MEKKFDTMMIDPAIALNAQGLRSDSEMNERIIAPESTKNTDVMETEGNSRKYREGIVRSALNDFGIYPESMFYDLSPAKLTVHALGTKEAILTDTGALAVMTGKYTGRSPKDKFIVDSEGVHDVISWGKVNRPISREIYDGIQQEVAAYLSDRTVYVHDGYAGADPEHRRKFRVVGEKATQILFIQNLLITDKKDSHEHPEQVDYTILVAPEFKCDAKRYGIHSEAAIMIDYEAHTALICGTGYSGEIKKTVFSIMNYVMPVEDGVLPMHCSANMDPETGDTAVFFGLSGTGKTTLSSSPDRLLIGDDEHGWSDNGVFNFEGGCYAKCLNLSPEREPAIYNAIRFGAIVENVVLDKETGHPDYDDPTYTENTRVSYPIEFVENAEPSEMGGIPKVVIFLTADAYGVLPPVSRLSQSAAMYHFITGFTAKVAGTESGITEPQPTFSTLFGEPFMPLEPVIYARMLGSRMEKYGTKVYLVNTGWTGGQYGVGHRINLKDTRAIVRAILDGSLESEEYVTDERFRLDVPMHCEGVEDSLLHPADAWGDAKAYEEQADRLASMFEKNFREKYPNMPKEIIEAGPHPLG